MEYYVDCSWQSLYASAAQLKKDIPEYTEPGWYKKNNDTALVLARPDGKLRVCIWNDADPRPGWKNLLDWPQRN